MRRLQAPLVPVLRCHPKSKPSKKAETENAHRGLRQLALALGLAGVVAEEAGQPGGGSLALWCRGLA